MEIIYKQTPADLTLESIGIQNCYLKHLSAKSDSKTTLRKTHHHAGFEIHFVNKGHQTYIADGEEYTVSEGCILLIPPFVRHCAADTQFYESKFSVTFNKCGAGIFECADRVMFLEANGRVADNFHTALRESKAASDYSRQIIAGCIYESLVILARMCGFKEGRCTVEDTREDDRLIFAKRYVKDNIEFNITVSDVAAHCCLGEKQLTRLFKAYENITPLQYIQKQKTEHIEALLQDGAGLKEVSERMNFSSEYYFNYFFKKHAGVSPGEYRKMHIKQC